MTSEQRTEEMPAPDPLTPARKMRAFQYFWLSRAISGLGSAVTTVAMPVLAYQVTKSPVIVALVSAAGTVPYVAFGLFAGALADRVDRRRLMIATDVLNVLCLVSIPLASALGVLTGAQIVVAALLSSSLTIFFDAGAYGLVPALVGKANLAEANSAVYAAETVVRVVGTGMAGALIALLRPAGTLAIDATSFIASAFLIRAVAYGSPAHGPAAGGRPGFRQSVAEGLRFLWGHPTLRLMTLAGTLQSFSGGALVGQLVVFADRVLQLHGANPRIGFLYTAWSVGGICGSVYFPRVLRRTRPFQVLLVALPVSTVLGLAFQLSWDWRVALVAVAAWGSVNIVILINTMTYSQEVTPPQLQSRVNTTRRMISSGLGVPLGALASSTLTIHFGIHTGMAVAVAAAGTGTALVWTAWFRKPSDPPATLT
jgi:MFS family permease